jgi:hypothetical protein
LPKLLEAYKRDGTCHLVELFGQNLEPLGDFRECIDIIRMYLSLRLVLTQPYFLRNPVNALLLPQHSDTVSMIFLAQCVEDGTEVYVPLTKGFYWLSFPNLALDGVRPSYVA